MEEYLSDRDKILARLQNKVVGDDVCKSEPEISVIIPAYNVASVISETLDSVLSQTFDNFEVIVINDGSEDTQDLKNAIRPYASRLVYADQANAGASAARNSAICLARGAYFAFLDGDDIWYPDLLASQYAFLTRNSLDMVYCNADFFGEPYPHDATSMQAAPPSIGEVTPISLLNMDCSVTTSGTLLKRSCIEKFGMFDLIALRGQDFDLWFRLSLNGVKIGYQTTSLLGYRVSSTGLTGNNVARSERGVAILKLVKSKYDLSDPQLSLINKRINHLASEVELENAKRCLVEQNFEDATSYLRKANVINGSMKLTLLSAMLKFAPRLVRLAFKIFRSREYDLISPKGG